MNMILEETQVFSKDGRPVRLTKDLMDCYRETLQKCGYKQHTINMYFCYLNKLYAFLPGEKELTENNLRQWVEDLKEKGYSDRTINLHISAANGLLRFCGEKKVPVTVTSDPRDVKKRELTREEYLKLLSYVQERGADREYLLIRTLATIDITVNELALLTVFSCRRGLVALPDHKEEEIPLSLQQELLAYIADRRITDGPVFVSRSGQPMDRSDITHAISRLGKAAGLDPGKCNPSALHRLYQQMQEEINERLSSMRSQVYNQMLDNERQGEGMLLNGGRRF